MKNSPNKIEPHTSLIKLKKYSKLVAPIAIDAIHDEDHMGLLPIHFLDKPIRFSLTTWNNPRPGDIYQAMLNNTLIGMVYRITDQQAGDPLLFDIAPQYLKTEGTYNIAYYVTESENATPMESESIQVKIDLTPPGLPQLRPIKFLSQIEEILTSAELTNLDNHLIAEIECYTDMYQNDTIRTFWNGVEGPNTIVSRTDVEQGRIQIVCTREFLEGLGDFNGMVTYTAMDRAGNVSQPSIGTPFQSFVTTPENFPAPIIDPNVGTLIDYAEACQGVAVDIPHFPGAAIGDQITLYWQNISLSPQQIHTIHKFNPTIMTFITPYLTIADKPRGPSHIYYDVKRNGELFGISQTSTVEVFVSWPGTNELEAPTIRSASTRPNTIDNFIDENSEGQAIQAVISWNSSFVIDDTLTLYWGNENIARRYQVTASDVSAQQDLLIPIPHTIVKATGSNSVILVFYTLTRTGNPNPSKSAVQTVVMRRRQCIHLTCLCRCPVIYSDSTGII